MMSSLPKYSFAASASGDAVVKAALESLPLDSVDMISEAELEGFLGVCQSQNLLPVVSLSRKASAPAVLRNIALTNQRMVKVAQVHQPSEQFLASIGNPAVPSILSMYPDRESEKPQYKVCT